jgi:ubiquinone/menaquinone biosynthesis C-methylase UbiE
MRTVLLLLTLLLLAPSHAVAASDGATSHRSFADVPYWSGVFDDPTRDAWQKPDALVASLGLKPGMCVADLGAGTGYFIRRLSAAVGPTGTVLAVEVEPNLVTHLRARAEKEGTANVVPILGSLDNPRLPAGAIDVLLIVDTYHHIDGRVAYMRTQRRALRPDGRVVVVDWEKRPLPVGPEMDHKLAREQVIDEMQRAGYRLVEQPPVLEHQYVLVFIPA